MGKKLFVPLNCRNFVTGWVSINFSRGVLHEVCYAGAIEGCLMDGRDHDI
jgi:hypothetical protein